MKVDLSPDDIAFLRSALDSAEYWDHRDELDHDSGYITDPHQNADGAWVDVNDEPLDEEALEAWEEVQEGRELDSRLAAYQR